MMLAYAEREEERSQIASIMTSILGLSAEEQKRLEGRRGSWLERIGRYCGRMFVENVACNFALAVG